MPITMDAPVGKKLGALTVLAFDRLENSRSLWLCRCDCGTERAFRSDHVLRGTASCGCVKAGQRAKAEAACPIGKRFGRLAVVAFGGFVTSNADQRARLTWVCRCDCGTELAIAAQSVARGRTESCGCFHKNDVGERAKGKPSNARKPFGQSSRNLLKCIYRTRARRRGRDFTLTDEEFDRLIFADCYYCGAPPSNRLEQSNLHGHLVYSGIDRVDNATGYGASNCVSCCGVCNRAKGAMSQSDFLALARAIADRHRDTDSPAAPCPIYDPGHGGAKDSVGN